MIIYIAAHHVTGEASPHPDLTLIFRIAAHHVTGDQELHEMMRERCM